MVTNYNSVAMRAFQRISRAAAVALMLLLSVHPGRAAQNDAVSQARTAMANGDYARAARLLSASIETQPSADAYLYLGISYSHIREWMRAENTLKDGASLYPQDPRFHNELAGVYLAANDLDRARESLRQALVVDPSNKYARDLLATVDMSMGNVKNALTAWNKDGRPVIGDILHNTHLEFENWIIGKASAFRTGETLTWGKWRTTEVRLRESGIYANVGVEIEPTPDPDRYTVVIRTASKTNSREQLVLPILESLFFKSPSLHWWNIGNSAASLDTNYRFATNRHRAVAGVRAPLPLPGLLFFEASGTFRSERWDISRPAANTGTDKRFHYQSTGIRAEVKHIPTYRVELGAGFEYRNRTGSGSLSGLALDSRNTGKLLLHATVLPFEGTYSSRLRAEAFVARKAFLSDIDYSGGTLEWNNRYVANAERRINFEWTVKGGMSHGQVPVDDYFVLGLDDHPENLLRGHNAVDGSGHYGHAPMGTSFMLVNTTLDYGIRRLPLFNVLNVPYVDLKWQVFLDGAKSFDRADVFQEGKLMVDVGTGFKLETPTKEFNLIYGRSLRDGTGTLAAYVQKRW